MTKKIIFVLFFINLFLGIALVIFSGNLSADGEELYQLENKIVSLQKERLEIEEKIASLSSLQRVQDEATKLGFKSNIVFVDYSSRKPVALVGR